MAYVEADHHTPQTSINSFDRNQAFSQQKIAGVYIPSAVLLVGVAVAKPEYLPYAAVLAALVGGYAVFASRM